MGRTRLWIITLSLATLTGAAASAQLQQAAPPETSPLPDPAISIGSMVRIDGTGASPLHGFGLVIGLPGTGDSGDELALARPLAELYRAHGTPLASLDELASAQSAALVYVTCETPEVGAVADDRLDVRVTPAFSATSLRGGTLILSPLRGPLPGDPVIAMARGLLEFEDPAMPTQGVVRGGAQLITDVLPPDVGAEFDLIIEPRYRGWETARLIASQINGAESQTFDPETLDPVEPSDPIASPSGPSAVRIRIPEHERARSTGFVARILRLGFSPSLLKMPATVRVNKRTGAIVASDDVHISPVAIAHKNLTVTTTTPALPPTPADPLIERSSWETLGTTREPAQEARVADLLAAFKQLDVPIEDQIELLQQIYRAGKLHADLIVE